MDNSLQQEDVQTEIRYQYVCKLKGVFVSSYFDSIEQVQGSVQALFLFNHSQTPPGQCSSAMLLKNPLKKHANTHTVLKE